MLLMPLCMKQCMLCVKKASNRCRWVFQSIESFIFLVVVFLAFLVPRSRMQHILR